TFRRHEIPEKLTEAPGFVWRAAQVGGLQESVGTNALLHQHPNQHLFANRGGRADFPNRRLLGYLAVLAVVDRCEGCDRGQHQYTQKENQLCPQRDTIAAKPDSDGEGRGWRRGVRALTSRGGLLSSCLY